MVDELIGKRVVVDLASPFVCLGTLSRVDQLMIELKNADFHDLRDTDTRRENYVAASIASGIKRNRRKVMISRHELVAITLLEDIVDG